MFLKKSIYNLFWNIFKSWLFLFVLPSQSFLFFFLYKSVSSWKYYWIQHTCTHVVFMWQALPSYTEFWKIGMKLTIFPHQRNGPILKDLISANKTSFSCFQQFFCNQTLKHNNAKEENLGQTEPLPEAKKKCRNPVSY